MLANCLFAAGLLLLAGLLTWHCEKSWREIRLRKMDQQEHSYCVRRRWRRLAIAGIIALIAAAIPLSTVIETVLLAKIYLVGLAICLLLMLVLALRDLAASQAFFAREKEKFASARDELEADLKRVREQHREQGNGQSH